MVLSRNESSDPVSKFLEAPEQFQLKDHVCLKFVQEGRRKYNWHTRAIVDKKKIFPAKDSKSLRFKLSFSRKNLNISEFQEPEISTFKNFMGFKSKMFNF